MINSALVGEFYALLEAALEPADERDVHAAHEADLAAFGGQRRQHTHQERAFLLLEHHRLHVGQVDHAVDDGEAGSGEFLGDLLECHRLRKADGDDRILAALGKPPQCLLELGLVTGLEFSEGDAGILLELLRTRAHAFVEGFIELSARAVDDSGLDGGLRSSLQGQQGAHQQGDQSQSGQSVHRANSLSCVSMEAIFRPTAPKQNLRFLMVTIT